MINHILVFKIPTAANIGSLELYDNWQFLNYSLNFSLNKNSLIAVQDLNLVILFEYRFNCSSTVDVQKGLRARGDRRSLNNVV